MPGTMPNTEGDSEQFLPTGGSGPDGETKFSIVKPETEKQLFLGKMENALQRKVTYEQDFEGRARFGAGILYKGKPSRWGQHKQRSESSKERGTL